MEKKLTLRLFSIWINLVMEESLCIFVSFFGEND